MPVWKVLMLSLVGMQVSLLNCLPPVLEISQIYFTGFKPLKMTPGERGGKSSKTSTLFSQVTVRDVNRV